MKRRARHAAVVSAGLLSVLIPLGLLWIPPLRHFHIPAASISPTVANGVLRGMNANACGELARFDLLPLGLPERRDSLAPIDPLARRLLDSLSRGVLPLQFGSRLIFSPTFAAADFGQPDSYLKLNVAGLAVPRALLWAWRTTRDPKWLALAHGYVDSWWKVERQTVLPRDFQWNDHAVAARALTLTAYLCAMRNQPQFTDSAAADVLTMLTTSGERLAKPEYFTFRTNHGVMQNIALLAIAANFPRLPQRARFADTARARLDAQLPYFVGPEGVVFEHSAHYHMWGTALLHMMLRYDEALGIPVPADRLLRYAKAVEFSRQLLRLDGSVPSWGNSFRGVRGSQVLAELSSIVDTTGDLQRQMELRAPATWAPTAGVAVWWASRPPVGTRAGLAAQTLVAWADFATQTHKHADDMSMLVWTARSDVLIASGYWPNDSPDYAQAYGWAGSNAPHFVGESGDVSPIPASSSPRPRGLTSVRGSASSPGVEFIDLERIAASGGRLRRQIVFVRPDLWVVVDAASGGQASEFETSWLLDPGLSVTPAVAGARFALDGFSGRVAQIDLAGCNGGSLHVERGSRAPFSGWTAADGPVAPTTALRRRCRTGDPSAMILRGAPPDGVDSRQPAPLVLEYMSPQRWLIRHSTGDTLVRRDSATVGVKGPACRDACIIRIRGDSGSNQARARIDSLYFAMQRHYPPPFREMLSFRISATKYLGALLVAQMLVLLAAGRVARRWTTQPVVVISALAILGWILVTVRLWTAYLR